MNSKMKSIIIIATLICFTVNPVFSYEKDAVKPEDRAKFFLYCTFCDISLGIDLKRERLDEISSARFADFFRASIIFPKAKIGLGLGTSVSYSSKYSRIPAHYLFPVYFYYFPWYKSKVEDKHGKDYMREFVKSTYFYGGLSLQPIFGAFGERRMIDIGVNLHPSLFKGILKHLSLKIGWMFEDYSDVEKIYIMASIGFKFYIPKWSDKEKARIEAGIEKPEKKVKKEEPLKEIKEERPVKVEEKKRVKKLELKNIAVSDFVPQAPVSPADATFVTDYFRGDLVKSEVLNVLDRNNMATILAEQGFQQTGCTDQECAVKLGKILNVQAVVTGNFGKLIDRYVLTIKLVLVESGKIIYSDKESCYSQDEIEDMALNLANRLIEATRR